MVPFTGTVSTQATNSYVQQSSNQGNTNSLVNSNNIIHNVYVNLPDSMKGLKIDVGEGGSWQVQGSGSSIPEENPSTPRASTGSYPNTHGSADQPDQVQPGNDVRENGYLASMRSGRYPKTKVKPKQLTHESDLPLPKHTPGSIAAYMRTLPRIEEDVIPLWSASPNTHREVMLGDVGIFNQRGGFETKFNIFRNTASEEDLEPPPQFVPCRQARVRVSDIEPDWQDAGGLNVVSENDGKTWTPQPFPQLRHSLPEHANGYCSGLYLPYGGRRLWIETSALPNIMQYAVTNANSWYCYKNTADDGEPLSKKYDDLWNKSLVVVTEVWKTSAWFSMLTTDRTDPMAASAAHQRRQIKATVHRSVSPNLPQCSYSYETGFMMNTGPESSVITSRQNQCVAIKGFQLIYDPKLPLWSPSSEQTSGGERSSIFSRISFLSRKTKKTKR